MRQLRIIAVPGICAGFAIGPAWAESNPFVGRWQWDPAQSALPASEPVPSQVTLDISRAESAHLTWLLSVLAAPGTSPEIETFDAPTDGQPHAINGDTTASFRFDRGILQATFRGPAGSADAMTCALSADQKTMTCKGVLSRSGGQTASYTDVYDRM
jgi:hypothetical protein